MLEYRKIISERSSNKEQHRNNEQYMCVCLTWENSEEMTYGIVASGHRRQESLETRKVSQEDLTTIFKSPDGIPILGLSFSHHLLKVIW